MAKRVKMLPVSRVHYRIQYPNVTAELDIKLERFEAQYSVAQFLLDSRVMSDMQPYMPMQSGTFINVTKAMSAAIAGSGKVVAAAPPYGRFLYKGKVMVDELTGSTWARPGGKKVLVSQYTGKTQAKEDIEFSTSANAKAQAEWFKAAKRDRGNTWIKNAKMRAGGG